MPIQKWIGNINWGTVSNLYKMNKKLTTYDFIEKAINIHGKRYDYTKVDYINSRTKVKIICPDHGIFEQTPTRHLNGNEGLRYRQICDKMKTNYAHKNGIELLRIPYTKIKEIPHILEEKIMTLIT